MKDVWITSCSHAIADTSEARVTLNSLTKVGFDGDKYVVTDWLPHAFGKLLTEKGFNLVVMNPSDRICVVNTDVLRYFIDILMQQSYRNAYVSDFRDVLYLKPFQKSESLDAVYLTAEGLKYRESQWNMNDYRAFNRYCKNISDIETKDVINGGGLIYGDARLMISFYAAQIGLRKENVSNQIVINYLYHFQLLPFLKLNPPEFCLTGEAVKHLKSLDYSGYTIFHQWDRTQARKQIIEAYL